MIRFCTNSLLSLDQQCCPNLIAYYFYKADDLLWWPLKVAAKRQRKINRRIISLHLKKTIFILAVYTFNSKLASPHFLYCVPFFPPPPWINPNLLNDFDTHVFFCKLLISVSTKIIVFHYNVILIVWFL